MAFQFSAMVNPVWLNGLVLLAASAPAQLTALTGATLIDGTGAEPVADAVVIVEDQTIQCAGTSSQCPIPEDAEVIELEDRWITPGLVDAHVHYSQTGWADGRPDSLDVRDRFPYAEVIASLEAHPERWHRAYLCSGVTAVFDVGGYPWTWDIREQAPGPSNAPHYAAAGPLLSTLDHWLNLPGTRQFIYLEQAADAAAAVDYLQAFRTDAVKLWLINTGARSIQDLQAIAAAAGGAAAEYGLPFIVHATGLAAAKAAVAGGADLLVHSVDDKAVDKAFVKAMLTNGVIYTPTLTVHRGYYQMYLAAISGDSPEIDDPNHCIDEDTRKKAALTARLGGLVAPRGETWLARFRERLQRMEATMAENLKTLYDAGVTIATGTDAGNPFTFHGPAIYAEMEAMQAAGMPPMAVIAASTRNAAEAMGRLKQIGTIEAGKIADLLILSANPAQDVSAFRELKYVMRAGVLYPQSQLQVTAP